MNKLLAVLLMGSLVTVALAFTNARRHDAEPRFEGRPLVEYAWAMTVQPRQHRKLARRIGPALTPYLIKVIQRSKSHTSDIFQTLYATAYDHAPAIVFPFIPEPISNEQRCVNAIRLLCYMGPEASGAVSGLIPLLSDRRFAADAAQALASIGSSARAAVPKLIEVLDDEVPWVATALGNIGPDAKEAVPALEWVLNKALTDGPGWFRREIERALLQINYQ